MEQSKIRGSYLPNYSCYNADNNIAKVLLLENFHHIFFRKMLEQEENDRVALKRQESKDCGVPMDVTKIPRYQQNKKRKTTFCDTRRNLLKKCLAFGMACVIALLVAVLVLHSEKVGEKTWQTDFYREEERIHALLCTKCNGFQPASDLSQYQTLGPVRVYHPRATGSICCVETADQLERLTRLAPPKPNQRRIFDWMAIYNRIWKPSAHLFLNVSKFTKQGEFMPWSSLAGSGTAFVSGGVAYSVQDEKVKVPASGHYYVYSHVTFRLKEPDLSKRRVSLYRHYILRSNPYLPNTDEQELLSASQTKLPLEKNRPYVLQSSYIGAILKLQKDDQLMVGVSEIASVFMVAEENFFGFYKI